MTDVSSSLILRRIPKLAAAQIFERLVREVLFVIKWQVVIIKRREPWKSNLAKGANRLQLMLNHMIQFAFLHWDGSMLQDRG